MSEEQDNLRKAAKVTLKSFTKGILVIAIIFILMFFLVGAVFVVNKDAFNKISEKNSTYSTSVDPNGNLVYIYTDPNDKTVTKTVTPEEMAKDFKSELSQYINEDDEKYTEIVTYFIQAETVTKQPYIDSSSKGEFNGQIKFYRYTESEEEVTASSVKEENRLKYMPLAEFNAKLEAYKTNAQANKDIFKRFTVDEKGSVLIACGEEEYRKINTGVDGTEKDRDLTVDIINKESTANGSYSGNSANGFESTEFKIFTKTIDYLPLIEQYVMPSNLLYALLVQTGDTDFVKAIADLAYGNEIAIGIYDNKTHSESKETYTYKKLIKMDVKTSLNFKDTLVSITDSKPSIELKLSDLKNSPYEYIPIRCETETIDNGNEEEIGKIKHRVIYRNEGYTGDTLHNNSMYINGTDVNNQITSLGEGTIFKTTYTRTIDSMSTPTIGILLADTWVARWEESYSKKEKSPSPQESEEKDLENKVIATYSYNNILSVFTEQLKNNISQQLNTHAEQLRTETINKIIELTPDSIYVAEIEETEETETTEKTEELTFSEEDKKTVLEQHLAECSSCKQAFAHAGYTHKNIDETFNVVTNAVSGALISVKSHYEAAWNEYVEEKQLEAEKKAKEEAEEKKENAVNKESERKEEFKRQLNELGTISYTTTLSGSKQYVNTKFSSSDSSTSSSYEKSGTIKRSEERRKIFRSI